MFPLGCGELGGSVCPPDTLGFGRHVIVAVGQVITVGAALPP
jgi:hypothetical protein